MEGIEVAEALLSAQARRPRLPDELKIGGTVLLYDATGNRAQVRIDGDLDGTWMSVFGNVTPTGGDRCWVTFPKPRGVFLSGLQ